MVTDQAMTVFTSEGMIGWKFAIAAAALIFIWLFLMMTFLPLVKKTLIGRRDKIHGEAHVLNNLSIQKIKTIAVALDFSERDEKLIAYALSQGNTDAKYLLLHVVESAPAKYLGSESDDDETRKDKQRLISYTDQLLTLGYTANAHIGYTNRIKEIVRMVHDNNADMLVMGAHRHSGLKDYLFGETIEAVRHELDIPVLIVSG
jgi:manganese transport protein